MNLQNLLNNFLSSGLNQKMTLHSFEDFDSREGVKKTIPLLFNKVHGVYVFEHVNHGVIYIGSSGKVPHNPKSQGIRNRILQGYTPYKLNKRIIRYHKKDSSNNETQEYHLSDITIHMIVMDKSPNLITIPSVLEHFLLQIFYNSKSILPYINRVI
jgi:hypothetical protein